MYKQKAGREFESDKHSKTAAITPLGSLLTFQPEFLDFEWERGMVDRYVIKEGTRAW